MSSPQPNPEDTQTNLPLLEQTREHECFVRDEKKRLRALIPERPSACAEASRKFREAVVQAGPPSTSNK